MTVREFIQELLLSSNLDDEIDDLTTKGICINGLTDGLSEGIWCAMCKNPNANERGCDGCCDVDKQMYESVMEEIDWHIKHI